MMQAAPLVSKTGQFSRHRLGTWSLDSRGRCPFARVVKVAPALADPAAARLDDLVLFPCTGEAVVPCALFSIMPGGTLSVSLAGRWQARHGPGMARLCPFRRGADGNGTIVLQVRQSGGIRTTMSAATSRPSAGPRWPDQEWPGPLARTGSIGRPSARPAHRGAAMPGAPVDVPLPPGGRRASGRRRDTPPDGGYQPAFWSIMYSVEIQ